MSVIFDNSYLTRGLSNRNWLKVSIISGSENLVVSRKLVVLLNGLNFMRLRRAHYTNPLPLALGIINGLYNGTCSI